MRHHVNKRDLRGKRLRSALAMLAVAPMGVFADAQAQLPLEYTPYSIDVHIALDDPADLSAATRAALHARLSHLAAAYIGPAWAVRPRDASGPIEGELLSQFEETSARRLVELALSEDRPHKAMYVVLHKQRGWWRVAVRELDFRTYQLSPAIQREALGPPRLAEDVLEAIIAAFSPVAELKAAQGGTVQGKLQAALLVASDDSPVLVPSGGPLVPILRRNDRLGRADPDDVLALAWTVLESSQRDGANMTFQIHSAHANPLGGRRRLRLVRYAQAVRYPPRPTRLTLQTPGESPTPLIGYDIVHRDAENGDVQVVGRTGEDGTVLLPATDDRWRMLYVRHGDRFLARLPVIAGWSDRYAVALPSDDVRLAAEGFVSAFRQEIIDTVARRQILAVRIRRRIAAGQFDEAEGLLEELRQLESARQFGQRMDAARAELVADDSRAQQLIDQMFTETRDTLQRYLDAGEAELLAKQLAAARAESSERR